MIVMINQCPNLWKYQTRSFNFLNESDKEFIIFFGDEQYIRRKHCTTSYSYKMYKKRKKSTSIVFRHYNIPDNPKGSVKAKYKHRGTTISGSTNATSNFLLYIKVLKNL